VFPAMYILMAPEMGRLFSHRTMVGHRGERVSELYNVRFLRSNGPQVLALNTLYDFTHLS
jgi:hypothetical protein